MHPLKSKPRHFFNIPPHDTATSFFLHPRAGNQDAASDLYGHGVRIGLYIQATGILLPAASLRVGGIKLASTCIMLALLVCWTKMARGCEFSPCEADLVSGMITVGGISASIVVLVPDNISFLGTLLSAVTGSWAHVSGMWLWATFLAQLPRLGTRNVAWCFTQVDINGCFRIFMLVFLSVTTMCVVGSVVFGVVIGLKVLDQGRPRTVSEKELEDIIKD